MPDFQIALPVVIHTLVLFSEHRTIIDTYLLRIFFFFGVINPLRLMESIIIRQLVGIRYQYHYRQFYPEIRSYFSSYCKLCGTDTIMRSVSKITNSMASWKLLLIQASFIKIRCPQLLYSGEKIVADIDVTTLRSSSSEKEGAEAGYNKKRKGKRCFRLSATFVGRIFVDARLFPGSCNPKDFFRKAVRRALSLGFAIEIVRADSAYMTPENLLFLTKLSLGYAIGAPATSDVVRKGKVLSEKLSRRKSSAIVFVSKGVALPDMGEVVLKNGVRTRIVIVRRINRTKKNGKWQINTFYYAIASNLQLSATKIYRFYHKRQGIEAGFREPENHYFLERLPFRTLKANEFRIMCKIMAMTLFKIFQKETLPKNLRTLLRKTLFRRIFQKGLYTDGTGEVRAVSEFRYTWHLRRMLSKIEKMKQHIII